MVEAPVPPALQITLVGRSYCSLCDKMRDALKLYAHDNAIDIRLEIIDLEDFPQYETQFGELIPVLLAGDITTGREICHYHFDEIAWNQWITVNPA